MSEMAFAIPGRYDSGWRRCGPRRRGASVRKSRGAGRL